MASDIVVGTAQFTNVINAASALSHLSIPADVGKMPAKLSKQARHGAAGAGALMQWLEIIRTQQPYVAHEFVTWLHVGCL